VLFASRFFGSAEPCKSGIEFQIYKVPQSTDPRSIFEVVDSVFLGSGLKILICDFWVRRSTYAGVCAFWGRFMNTFVGLVATGPDVAHVRFRTWASSTARCTAASRLRSSFFPACWRFGGSVSIANVQGRSKAGNSGGKRSG
jgi:hypothetical protein